MVGEWETKACFARSKSMDLNDFLIHSNALNIRLSRNSITESRRDGFREYIINHNYFLIPTLNKNNLIYSSLKHQRGR